MQFKIQSPGNNKLVKSDKSIVELPLQYRKTGAGALKIENTGDKMLFVKLYNTGKPLESNDLATSKNLKMKISYFDTNGNSIDVNKLKQGTDFLIEVTVTHPGILLPYKNMALTQIFPPGWEITNSRMDNMASVKSSSFTYQDIRDDRVMTYFDLGRGQTKTFRLMANASYAGNYYLPSTKCEAMYDHNILAVSNGAWVKVVSNK
jgi:uncharacterized protein YfaS (alpha-2-macroglobulin family)